MARLVFFVRAAVLAGVMCSVAGSVSPVAADDLETLLQRGVEFRKQGKEREALDAFNQAAKIQKTPRVLAQIALAEQALGLWVAAETHLKEALEARTDPWIQKNLTALSGAMEVIADHVGRLDLWGEPAGAEILIDGERVGTLPKDGISLAVGTASLTVRAPGYADATREIDVRKRMLVREHIKLRPLTAGQPLRLDAKDTGAAAERAPEATLVGEPGAPSATKDDKPIYKKWWFWTIVGAAAVGAGVTAVIVSSDSGLACDPNIPCGIW